MTHQWSEAIHDVDWQELADLYERAPLAKKEPARLQTAFSHSMFRWFVRDGQGQLIGAGRALADGSDCADHKKIILYCVPGKEGFYQSLGFKRMTTAMAMFQNEAVYLERGYIRSD
jgi:hypothetical protein